MFDHSVSGPTATRQLFWICQGQRPVSDYAIEIHTLAASAGWGERELHGEYYNGLSERLLDELSTCNLPISLEGLVDLTLRIDARLADRRASRRFWDPERSWVGSRTRGQAPSCAVEVPEAKPMQAHQALHGRATMTLQQPSLSVLWRIRAPSVNLPVKKTTPVSE